MHSSFYALTICILKEHIINMFGIHCSVDFIKHIMTAHYDLVKSNCGKFSCGTFHTGWIINTKLYVWGKNESNELGLRNIQKVCTPQKVPYLTCKYVVCKYDKTFYIEDGNIWRLGTRLKLSVPTLYPSDPSDCENMICGYDFELILTKSNIIYLQYDHYETKKIHIPNIKKIRCDTDIVYFLTKCGKLYEHVVSTEKYYHSESMSSFYWNNDIDMPVFCVPIQNVRKVECGSDFMIVLTVDNKLYLWGKNKFGQLGFGNLKNQYVHQPQELVLDKNKQLIIKSISCGAHHTIVLTTGGEIYVWGYNNYGQLGLGHTRDIYVPLKLSLTGITKINSGDHFVIVERGDELFAWGYNEFGQLGLGDYTDRHVPTKLHIKHI